MAEFGAGTRGTPPGWYDDTAGRARWRYWDGSAWTPWIDVGDTTVPDPLGVPDAAAPSPASRAEGPQPRYDESAPVARLPAVQRGARPTPLTRDRNVVAGALIALVGAGITTIAATLYANAPPPTGLENLSDEMALDLLLAELGIWLLGMGLLVLVVMVSARILHNARRRPRPRR